MVVVGRVVVLLDGVIDGVRGDVGDFNESAVRRRFVRAAKCSFSWRRGDLRRERGEEEGSVMSVWEEVMEMSVSASDSVEEEEEEEDGLEGSIAGKG
jgi:hypothetical protein